MEILADVHILGSQWVWMAMAFLLGSFPTGWVVAKAMGVDILKLGSGNIGATNVFRILGKGPGILVLGVDALKGYAACRWAGGWVGAASTPLWIPLAAGFAAILGHNYTPWLKFKGGKGIATSAGVLLAVMPKALGLAFSTWVIVFALSRYVSLASIAAAVALPFAAWFMGSGPILTGVASAMAALAIFKHRANIQRLRNGTENRIGSPKANASVKGGDR